MGKLAGKVKKLRLQARKMIVKAPLTLSFWKAGINFLTVTPDFLTVRVNFLTVTHNFITIGANFSTMRASFLGAKNSFFDPNARIPPPQPPPGTFAGGS